MDKIVNSACKVDFHIHSCHSYKTDGKAVNKLNIEHIPVLVDKLNENNVNICSISDHNVFSYEMYHKLKEQEGKGSIKKVLPAVEFSVAFNPDESVGPMHVVVIFDDSDDDKIKAMESIIARDDSHPNFNNGDKNYFSKDGFLSLLNKIGVDCVFIGHQKNTLQSDFGPQKRDANSQGEGYFADFVQSEFFEAYEFKNRSNEIFNKFAMADYNKDGKDLLRFMTGTDCHDWDVYPKSHADDVDIDFPFTYLKCLPNFKGVALALTEGTRIKNSDNFFSVSKKYQDNIELDIGDSHYNIPLSRGINVIIGENSIGKSLFLRKMIDYDDIKDAKLKNGYNNFLKEHKIENISKIDSSNIRKFDAQGSIRKYFTEDNLQFDDTFSDLFPEDFSTGNAKEILEKKVNDVCNNLKNQFDYENEYKKIKGFTIKIESDFDKYYLTPTTIVMNDINSKKKNNEEIINDFISAATKLTEAKNLIAIEEDKKQIDDIIEQIESLKAKYETQKKRLQLTLDCADAINSAFAGQNSQNAGKKTDLEKESSQYSMDKQNFFNNLTRVIKKYFEIQPINYSLNVASENMPMLVDQRKLFDKYLFVKKTSIDTLDETYIRSLLCSPLNKNKTKKNNYFDDIRGIHQDTFADDLNSYNNNSGLDMISFYKDKIMEKVNNDLTISGSIVKEGDNINTRYSNGVNTQIYFDIYSYDSSKDGIYIIDQPEDDVSPLAIKDYLLSDFNKMREARQIILVTHNPQFVVNLDVDNVIYMFYNRDKNGEIDIRSGALEYSDDEYNVLDIVANSLDGGMESIRKRWKRYDKDNSNQNE